MPPATSNRPPVDDDTRSTSSSENSQSSNEEGWEDLEPEEDSQPVIGLFSDKVYPDARSMLAESKDKYGFDLLGIRKALGV